MRGTFLKFQRHVRGQSGGSWGWQTQLDHSQVCARVDWNCQPIGTPQNAIPDVQELISLGGGIMAPPV